MLATVTPLSGIEAPVCLSTETTDAAAESRFRTMNADDYQIIRQLFDDYLRMYASRDDRLTSHFSEDFSGITGSGDFLVKDREEWVAITRQDFAQVKEPIRIELKDLVLQSLADTIAVATSSFIIHLPFKDHVLSRKTARLVLIFRKEPAGWKISHSSISIPFGLAHDGEVYPMKDLEERNQFLEELVAERTIQLSEANDNLKKMNQELSREIAEHRKTEEELNRKNAEIEQFIYTVSHDLRSPLVTVKTFLGFLENDMSGTQQERVSQDLQFIHGAADKMKMLLDELLEMSRIVHVETPPVRISFLGLMAEVQDVLAGVISERKVDIQLPDSDMILFGDRPRLCQIWQNLVENAIKYSRIDSSPRIELGLRQENGETVFYVKDNGIGIDQQYGAKIFGIFEKLDPKSPGAGLGLSMIQRIVEKYGGRVWVESEGSGSGSCFFFTLPQALVER